ncbi:hypothetical protein [Streptomyces sp. AC550_RSS872]|nr:hypothetical protein [Streptomyces sp. AC550_RSS872]
MRLIEATSVVPDETGSMPSGTPTSHAPDDVTSKADGMSIGSGYMYTNCT